MQKHLNRECEGSSLFEDQCFPHVFLIDLKLSACHVLVLLLAPNREGTQVPTSNERKHSLRSET
jgi:hypothetical protein